MQKRMRRRKPLLLAILAMSGMHFSATLPAEIVTGTDELAKLPYWEYRSDYMTLRFVQRLPDQTRAYFAGRGFKQAEIDLIASKCVFQTVYKNITKGENQRVIQHNIRDWRYHANGKTLMMRPREDWKTEWQKRNVPVAQQVAFEWSLLPTTQVFQAGDYNWGMSFIALPHGTTFDLDIAWQVDGKPQQQTIKNMTCAKDENLAPQ